MDSPCPIQLAYLSPAFRVENNIRFPRQIFKANSIRFLNLNADLNLGVIFTEVSNAPSSDLGDPSLEPVRLRFDGTQCSSQHLKVNKLRSIAKIVNRRNKLLYRHLWEVIVVYNRATVCLGAPNDVAGRGLAESLPVDTMRHIDPRAQR
jgi:hypothetical protein